jgi:hypothetical protein
MEQIEDSKHLAAAGWEGGVLTIQFQSGDVYEYYDVPSGVFQELMGAASKSEFFRMAIKGTYEYARVG